MACSPFKPMTRSARQRRAPATWLGGTRSHRPRRRRGPDIAQRLTRRAGEVADSPALQTDGHGQDDDLQHRRPTPGMGDARSVRMPLARRRRLLCHCACRPARLTRSASRSRGALGSNPGLPLSTPPPARRSRSWPWARLSTRRFLRAPPIWPPGNVQVRHAAAASPSLAGHAATILVVFLRPAAKTDTARALRTDTMHRRRPQWLSPVCSRPTTCTCGACWTARCSGPFSSAPRPTGRRSGRTTKPACRASSPTRSRSTAATTWPKVGRVLTTCASAPLSHSHRPVLPGKSPPPSPPRAHSLSGPAQRVRLEGVTMLWTAPGAAPHKFAAFTPEKKVRGYAAVGRPCVARRGRRPCARCADSSVTPRAEGGGHVARPRLPVSVCTRTTRPRRRWRKRPFSRLKRCPCTGTEPVRAVPGDEARR